MNKYFVIFVLVLLNNNFCKGQTVETICGNEITISVVGDAAFPTDTSSSDVRANSTGLVAGFTEHCDKDGPAPESPCKFSETTDNFTLTISDFSTCNITAQYNADDDVTEVTVLVSRIPVVVAGIRRSECGRIAVVCKYDKLLENVTYASSVNVTRDDYVGTNDTSVSTDDVYLHLIKSAGTGSSVGVEIDPGKTYDLEEAVHVEAVAYDGDDKFVSTLKNCYASKAASMDNNYLLIGADGCANPDDGSVFVETPFEVLPYFRFGAFLWTSFETTIYLHCEVETCLTDDEVCKAAMTKCSGSKLNRLKRRSAAKVKTTKTAAKITVNVKRSN